MKPGEKVFQDDGVGSDKDTSKPKAPSSSALEDGTVNTGVPGDDENYTQSLLHKENTEFFSWFCCSRSLGVWCLAITFVFIGSLLWQVFGEVGPVLGVLVGIIAPPALWMAFFSEAVGGASSDRRQMAIVIVTCWGLLVGWLILNDIITYISVRTGFFNAQVAFTRASEDPCCQFIPDENTTHRPEFLSWDPKNACICPITGFFFVLKSAVPEEILKYLAISFFTYRSYVADPDAVISLGIASGGAFALAENVIYVFKLGKAALFLRFLFPMPMHIISQMIMATYLAKKKFVHKEMGGKFDCSCKGKIPAYKIIGIGILVHTIHNFVISAFAKSVSNYWHMVFPYLVIILNLIFWHLFARMKYIELDQVPRVNIRKLQMLHWLPKGFCCYCCADNALRRERRLESIYEMSERAKEFGTATSPVGNNTQQYAPPPTGIQMKLTLPIGAQTGTKVKYPLSNGKEIFYTVKEGQKAGDVVDIVV